jgi:DNA-directed RNA polymerase specialized sigma24 family protein
MDRDGTNAGSRARRAPTSARTLEPETPHVASAVPVAPASHVGLWRARSHGDREGLSPDALRAFLATADVLDHVRAVVVRRLGGAPAAIVDDLVQDAHVAAMSARVPPRTIATARGWVATVTARVVVNHFRDHAADRQWLDREADVEVQADAAAEPFAEPWLVATWLAQAVAGDARDEETFEMLVYKAQTGHTHEDVARAHGISPGALKARIHDFKTKYEPRWRRHRDRTVVLWLAAFAIAAASVGIAWWLARPSPPPSAPHTPTPTFMPQTHATATPEEPFTPAESAPRSPPPVPAREAKPPAASPTH